MRDKVLGFPSSYLICVLWYFLATCLGRHYTKRFYGKILVLGNHPIIRWKSVWEVHAAQRVTNYSNLCISLMLFLSYVSFYNGKSIKVVAKHINLGIAFLQPHSGDKSSFHLLNYPNFCLLMWKMEFPNLLCGSAKDKVIILSFKQSCC